LRAVYVFRVTSIKSGVCPEIVAKCALNCGKASFLTICPTVFPKHKHGIDLQTRTHLV